MTTRFSRETTAEELALEGVKVDHLAVEGDEGSAVETQWFRVGSEGDRTHFMHASLFVLVVAREKETGVNLHTVRLQRLCHHRLHITVVEASRLRNKNKDCTCTSYI